MARSDDKWEPSRADDAARNRARADTFAPLMRRVWLLTAALAALVAGCGGEEKRQDADEPEGEWVVEVVDAEFPRSQKLARQETMTIAVRNAADRAIPNLALTVDGFSRRSEQAGLADPNRPVWVVDDAPRGGVTAYTNTWALGRVAPGATKTFSFKVTPVVASPEGKPFRLRWRISAGLDGKAKARLASGGRPEGSFAVEVSREPSQSRVDPDTGDVVRR